MQYKGMQEYKRNVKRLENANSRTVILLPRYGIGKLCFPLVLIEAPYKDALARAKLLVG
jgi:hypothetical protein